MNEQRLNSLLLDLISLPSETEWLEFKTNNDSKIGEYLSGLANSACIHGQDFGYLIFGVDDKTHQIVGTNVNVRRKAKGNEDLEPWLARLLNPRVDFRIFQLNKNGYIIIIFRVQAASNIPVKFHGVAYIRIGSNLKSLEDYPEKQRLIWKKEPNYTFETGVAKSDQSGNEVLSLIDYASYFELTNQNLPPNRSRILEKLAQEKIIKRSSNNNYDITNLGALLFAKKLTEFEGIERKGVRVIIYHGTNRLKTKKEQLGTKGYAAGFSGLVSYINDQLPTNERIDEAFRVEESMYPKLAIRELVANALIHQDFHERGAGPMVEIFSNRIEITNPGKPLISILRFIDHNPQSRNEKLASFMRRMNICEERGSGIDKVIYECELHQLPAPNFIEGPNYTRVTLQEAKKFRDMDKEEKIRAAYLHSCIKHVSGEYMTNQSLRMRFGVAERNYSMISRIIADTLDQEYIKYFDPESKSKKHAKYVPFWA